MGLNPFPNGYRYALLQGGQGKYTLCEAIVEHSLWDVHCIRIAFKAPCWGFYEPLAITTDLPCIVCNDHLRVKILCPASAG